ncbi:Cation efflux family protein [Hibiscus syriacus]|uniref:Cation efflux family protein n=1 Tax=Hibiscus syriacus TaxID=106335 RepID=A0A6A3AU00_HIBSY|nr:Cation efflux family protein [Hibiscus syriacus]
MNNLRTDSSDYRAELLSPTPVGENHVIIRVSNRGRSRVFGYFGFTVIAGRYCGHRGHYCGHRGEQSWRLNMDKFNLPERRTESSCFSLGYYIKAFRRQRRLSKYYKRQEVLLKGFNEMDTFNELGVLPGSLSEEEEKQLARNERVVIIGIECGEFGAFPGKSFILWFTTYAMRQPNHYRYPIGKNRMQPVVLKDFNFLDKKQWWNSPGVCVDSCESHCKLDVVWQPPNSGGLKFNVDRTASRGAAGCGGMLRT